MYPSRWQSAILAAVQEQGRLSIAELAARLRLSDETIRRHVRPLVENGSLDREHGAVAAREIAGEPPFSRRLKEAAEAKRAIARAAAELVEDGQTIMIDTGSTTAYVAGALNRRRDLTVITNSVEIARQLVGRHGHRVFMAGGELRADIAAAVGPEALAFIDRFRADLAIISVGAIHSDHGFMDFDFSEAEIARSMLARSGQAIVVADSRKFAARAGVQVCPFGDVAHLVTDRTPLDPYATQLRACGVNVVVQQP